MLSNAPNAMSKASALSFSVTSDVAETSALRFLKMQSRSQLIHLFHWPVYDAICVADGWSSECMNGLYLVVVM